MDNNYIKNAYYLMIKNGFYNEELDDALLNLLLIVIKNKHYEKISDIDVLVDDFKDIIGFKLPYFPMKTTLIKAKNKGYVDDGLAKGEYIPNHSKIGKVSSMAEIISREKSVNELRKSFYDYLMKTEKSSEFDEDKAGDLIDSFIENQGALFYSDKEKYFSNAHEDYLFASFICNQNNRKYYDLIDELIAGRILSELLLHEDEQVDIDKCSFRGTNVYLDAGLIFILLDIDELHRSENYKQLLSDMKALGISLKIFKHTLCEVESVIHNSIVWIDNHDFDPCLASKTAYYFVTNNVSKEDVEEILATMNIKLSELGIEIEDMDYPTNVPEGEYCQEDYYEAIKNYYRERNISFDEEELRYTIDNDAKSFFFINVKNNYIRSFQLSNLKNLLLTNNTSLAIVSKRMYDKQKNIPFCVTDTFFGALIWKSNPKMIGIPSKQKLSNFIYQAFSPSDAMLEKFSNVIDKSLQEQTITNEECIVLKQNKLAAKMLVEVTTGDIEQINIDTPQDVMKRIRETAIELGRNEVREEKDRIIKEKEEIIVKQTEAVKDSKVEAMAANIRHSESTIESLKNIIRILTDERNRGKSTVEKRMKIIGIGFVLLCLVVIGFSIFLFNYGVKNNVDYLGLISFIVSFLILVAPIVAAMVSNKNINLKSVINAIKQKKLDKYYEEHECTDDVLNSNKEKLAEENKQCELLKKKMNEFYFSK